MNAVTAFEHRKDQLKEQLLAAKDTQQAVLACTMALEQTACELAQDEQDETVRQRQQAVLAVVRRVPSILQSVSAKGELVLPQEEEAAPSIDKSRYMQMIGVIALCGLAVYEYLTLFLHFIGLFLGHEAAHQVGSAVTVTGQQTHHLHDLFLVYHTTIGYVKYIF